MTGTSPTHRLSEFISSFELHDAPEATRAKVEQLTMDGVAAGLFGSLLPWSGRAVRGLGALGATGPAAVWGRGVRTSPEHAAMLNSSFVQGFELDDYHEFGPIHSASIVVPAAFALVESRDVATDPMDVAAAIAVGMEVGTHVGTTIGGYDLISRGWHCGAVYGTLAAAATCSRLLRLDPGETEDALGIAATQSSGLMSAQFEAEVKRMHHGFSARAGLVAASLAASGYTGIKRVLERDYGGFGSVFAPGRQIDWDGMADELGSVWEIDRIALKAYACNAGIHPSIDGVRAWLADGLIDPDALGHLEITVPDAPFKHAGWEAARPLNAIGAQMNLAYTVAATLHTGDAFVDAFLPERLDDDAIWRLVERISVTWESDWQAVTDERGTPRATRLRWTSAAGETIEKVVDAARGTTSRPLTQAEVRDKARKVLRHVCDDDDQVENVIASVAGLERGDWSLEGIVGELARDRTHHVARLGFEGEDRAAARAD